MKTAWFDTLKHYLYDSVFPIFCLVCQKEGVWMCVECQQHICATPVMACPICHKNNQYGTSCVSCKKFSFLEKHFALYPYKNPHVIKKIIQIFKYGFVEDLGQILVFLIEKDVLIHKHWFENIDQITFVPLHKRRFLERGFNQSEFIAKVLGFLLNTRVQNVLKRVRYTKKQVNLSRKKRIQNVKDVFALEVGSEIQGKSILLVDDVYTSGATLQECAKVLKEHGAKRVIGFSLARG